MSCGNEQLFSLFMLHIFLAWASHYFLPIQFHLRTPFSAIRPREVEAFDEQIEVSSPTDQASRDCLEVSPNEWACALVVPAYLHKWREWASGGSCKTTKGKHSTLGNIFIGSCLGKALSPLVRVNDKNRYLYSLRKNSPWPWTSSWLFFLPVIRLSGHWRCSFVFSFQPFPRLFLFLLK